MKNHLTYIIYIILLSIGNNVLAQHTCGHDMVLEHFESLAPGAIDNFNLLIQEAARNPRAQNRGNTLQIPIVFHIVYKSEEENISDAVLESQIEVLNEDFQGLTDGGNAHSSVFDNIVGTPNLEFYIHEVIRQDTEREFTTPLLGIKKADEVKYSETGGSDALDTDQFLNIWICKIGITPFNLGQVFGYAYPPRDHSLWPNSSNPILDGSDGVVLDYRTIGRDNNRKFVNILNGENFEFEGHVATHEIGHYLGLPHIFGAGSAPCQDDGISDTPICNANYFGCGEDISDSCVDADNPDSTQVDMVENFMNNSYDKCLNSFTKGQSEVIINTLMVHRCGLIGVCENNKEIKIEEINVYPNPSSGILNFDSKNNFNIEKITVRNSLGQIVYSEENTFLNNINLSNSTNGVYFIEFESNSEKTIKRVYISN